MLIKKILQFTAISFAAVSILVACSDGEAATTSNGEAVKKVKVAYDQSGKPMTYIDENGNPTGYDVEVMKLVDEILEDYEFEFVGTSNDDLLIGVEQGKYQVGVKNAFWTEERTAKFIFPQEFLGLSSAGLVVKKKMPILKI